MRNRELLISTLRALDKTNWETLRFLLQREGAKITEEYISHCIEHPKEWLYEKIADYYLKISDGVDEDASTEVATPEEKKKLAKAEDKFMLAMARYWDRDESIKGRELQRRAKRYLNARLMAYGDALEEKEN